jgi:sigma-B regulation protein RsbU (phosphoserine phosphatase)
MNHQDFAEVASKKNIGELTATIEQAAESLHGLSSVSLWEIISNDGELLYSSRGSLQDTPLIDAGSLSVIVDTKAPLNGGVVRDSQSGFIAAVANPLLRSDGTVGAVVAVAADLHPG